MNLNDKNLTDSDQSATTNKIDSQVKNNDNIDNDKNSGTYLLESSANGSMPVSGDLPTSPSSTVEEISIYNIRTNLRRNLILAAISLIAFLLPFCDTMYLPALDMIRINLNTTNTLVVASVSVFLFMSGISCIIWGPISDRFGRKITTVIALVIFLVATLACIFSPNITTLIVLRGLEGGAASATAVVGQSFVADIYSEEKRGAASGIFFLPFNIGPIIGPLVGGPLSQAFGWRSTFIFLSVFSFIALFIVLIVVPETHHYFAKKHFEKANPNKRIIDATHNDILPFGKFLKSLIHLIDLTTMPYIILASTLFATLYTCFAVYPIYLHEPPYDYSETMIGVLYVPSGVTLFIASLFGGWVSDKASEYYGHGKCPEGRLLPGIILSILTPIGLLIYGWTFQYKVNIAGPIIGQTLVCFGQAVFEPSISAYLTIIKQKDAGTVSALNTFFNFCTGGIIVTAAVPLVNVMGLGPFFSLMCGMNIVTIALASVFLYKKLKRTDYVPL